MEGTVTISAAWRTDRGLVRSHNEDYVITYEPEEPADEARNGRLYIVADGVGGADAGEVASQFASERTRDHYLASDAPDLGARLIEAMQSANTDLRRMAAERDDSKRMATTMVAAVIQDGQAFIGNVGDSRAYQWRAGTLEQITRDQSLVARLLEEGAITAEEAARYPYKNVILYSIGSEKRPPIDLYHVELAPGDALVLCSDGLTRHLLDREIGVLVGEEPPEQAVETLVEIARERGGEDNITVAIVQHGERPAAAVAPPLEVPAEPELVVAAQPAAARASVPAVEETHRLLPLTLALTAVMVILIVLLWYFIQMTTAI